MGDRAMNEHSDSTQDTPGAPAADSKADELDSQLVALARNCSDAA
jgi:hypothetical protein